MAPLRTTARFHFLPYYSMNKLVDAMWAEVSPEMQAHALKLVATVAGSLLFAAALNPTTARTRTFISLTISPCLP